MAGVQEFSAFSFPIGVKGSVITLDPTPKGPCTQYLGTWGIGNSNYNTDLGYVYEYWVLGPSGYACYAPATFVVKLHLSIKETRGKGLNPKP